MRLPKKLSRLLTRSTTRRALSLDTPHLRLAHCRHGLMLHNIRDAYIGRSLDLYGEYSQGEIDCFAQLLVKDAVAIDVGANIGVHTVWMARAVGPSGHVIAIEPQRSIFQMLCANLAVNGLDNVAAHWAAAGRAPGEITVPKLDYTVENNFGGIGLGQVTRGYSVPVLTIDRLTNDGLKLAGCRLIKIDVEGMEEAVLAGAEATIARHRPALYVENDRGKNSAALIETIFRLGYRAWWHAPRLFNADNFRSARENVFGDVASINLLCLHGAADVNIKGYREVTSPEDSL